MEHDPLGLTEDQRFKSDISEWVERVAPQWLTAFDEGLTSFLKGVKKADERRNQA